MSIQNVKIALETALKTAFPTEKINWENVAFNPPADGSMYMVVNLLPATPENPTMGDGFFREVGLMQITLSYPIDGGSGKAYAKAEEIRALFPRGSTCANGGITTMIARTPTIGPGSVQKDRFILPIRIQYFSNVFA